MTRWFDDDSFWTAIEPFIFSDARCGEGAAIEAGQAVTLLGIAPPSAVLDLCCGRGRHSLELARRGFRVTGVDRNASYLERARRRADADGLAIDWVQVDMGHFRRPGAFDAAFNLFTSFGYFETDEEELGVLANVCESLKPGGRFLVDVMGKEVMARSFHPRTWDPSPDGTGFLLQERTIRSGWAYFDNRWIVVDQAGYREFRFPIRVYSAKELETLLLRAGFSQVTFHGTLAGAPYDHEAKRLVALAVK